MKLIQRNNFINFCLDGLKSMTKYIILLKIEKFYNLKKKNSDNSKAQQFYNFLFSSSAKQILTNFGYAVDDIELKK